MEINIDFVLSEELEELTGGKDIETRILIIRQREGLHSAFEEDAADFDSAD